MNRPARAFTIAAVAWLLVAASLTWYMLARNPSFHMTLDSGSYHDAAVQLLENGCFRDFRGDPEVFRTPGFSVVLAGIYAVFGDSALPVVVAQFLLVMLSALFCGNMAARMSAKHGLSPATARLWTTGAVMFCPVLLMSSLVLLSEILFVTVTVSAIWLLTAGIEEKKFFHALCGMFLVTAAAFVRPIAVYLPAILFVAALPFLWKHRSWMIAGAFALGIIVHVAAVYGWSQRNARHTGQPTFALVQEVNLYGYIASSIDAHVQGRDWEEVRSEYAATLTTVPRHERVGYMRAHARKVIVENPLVAAKVWLRGVAVLALQPATAQLATLFQLRESGSGIIYRFVSMPLRDFLAYAWEKERALLLFMIPGILGLGVFWAITLRGVVLCLRRFGPLPAILVAQIVYFILVSGGPYTLDRFRAPIVPLCAVFLGLAMARFFRPGKVD